MGGFEGQPPALRTYLRPGEHFPLSAAARGGGVPAGTGVPECLWNYQAGSHLLQALYFPARASHVRPAPTHRCGGWVSGHSGVCPQLDGQDGVVLPHMMLDLLLSTRECFSRSRIGQALSWMLEMQLQAGFVSEQISVGASQKG